MENQPTTKQVVLFTVILSFIVSILGTTLALGIIGAPLSDAENIPFIFNRPKILESIIQKETSELILRQDELVVQAVAQASPAVVSIVASKDVPVVERFFIDPFENDPLIKQFFGDSGSGIQVPQFRQKGTQHQEVSSGSGFLASPDGYIITNKHVVADSEAEYTALLNDGSKKDAKVLARDPMHDIAVLKIEGADYPYLKFGDSSKTKIGQTVIAIGNALGEFQNTVSVGVVSGLQRSIVAQGATSGPENLQELIQTDAAINLGNSGGPLLNIRGEVVGINTAVAAGAQGIGFAIPGNKAARSLESVKLNGKISYPFLGVLYVTITKVLAVEKKLGKDFGVLVQGSNGEPAVIVGSPAEKAGIKAGDIILELNGDRIDTEHAFSSLVQKYQIGEEISLKLFREGKEFEVKVKLEERK